MYINHSGLYLSNKEDESIPYLDNTEEESVLAFPEYDENNPMSFYPSSSGNAFSIYTINENLKINNGLLLASVSVLSIICGVLLVSGFWGRFKK